MLNRRVHPSFPRRDRWARAAISLRWRTWRWRSSARATCEFGGPAPARRRSARGVGAAPLVLEAKEGLALINGTQLMTAVAGLALGRGLAPRRARADVVGALTLDALKGTDVAFDPRIHAARPHPGQGASARNLKRLLAGSALRESHRDCGKRAGRLQPALHAPGARRRARRPRLR